DARIALDIISKLAVGVAVPIPTWAKEIKLKNTHTRRV
ncbi:MAG: hypothetical protein ACI9LF_001969, partial [Flavobacteriales bacterium]